MRVLITEPEVYNRNLVNVLPKKWDCDFKNFLNAKDLTEYLKINSFDIIFGRLGLYFNEKFFKTAKSLKFFVTPTTGLDHIDLNAALRYKVKIISLRGEINILKDITSTAEHAWSLLLACTRQLIKLNDRAKSGHWKRTDFCLNQISKKKIGIIGYGRLGKMIAQYAKAFRMIIYVCEKNDKSTYLPKYIERISLNRLLKYSDYVMLSASYNAGDEFILTRKKIMSMKNGSVLINISRGELIDEKAMIEALTVNKIKMAGLDVLKGDSKWNSSNKINSEFLKFAKKNDKIILTPHVGGYAIEALESTREYLINKVDKLTKRNKVY